MIHTASRTGGGLHAALPSFAVMAMLALTACGPEPLPISAEPPLPRPDVSEDAPDQEEIRRARAERNRQINQAAADAAAQASERSRLRREFYARVERDLILAGKLRRDRVPMDAPINVDTLVENFVTVALRDEYAPDGQRVTGGKPSPLRRWDQPVRLHLEFGASANQALRNHVTGEVTAYAARLATITGHPISVSGRGGNFAVMILSEDERLQIGARLNELVPGMPPADIATIRDLAQGNTCMVFAYSRGDQPVYAHAVALIRAELPSLLRTSCIHEEIAQGLGLANDDFGVRPSVFNDDEEFAMLTRHDELLLQILYDPRLRPGMTEDEARPIVRRIATELLGETA